MKCNISFVFVVVQLFLHPHLSFSQFDQKLESKIWQTRQIDVIRSLYTDASGMPSHQSFLAAHGLVQKNVEFEQIPYFRASFINKDVTVTGDKVVIKENAKPVLLDFFIEYQKKYTSLNTAMPVWDGRVYNDGNKVIVGGYSSKFNEKPIAVINSKGEFKPTISEKLIKNFPMLAIPQKNIVFDPFEWRLLNVQTVGEKEISEKSCDYLPLQVMDNDFSVLKDLQFFVNSGANNTIAAFAQAGNNKIKLAECNFSSLIQSHIAGYQPKLITGCIQPENGQVITVIFEGEFTKSVTFFENLLLLNDVTATGTLQSKSESISIDGRFNEWRSIQGIDDPEGDYVSYLYPNPDTDILEFKVSHDNQFLYFYSRLAGAHGRTGPNGRYYWYTYIDIDADPNTGYPPTRDDNCYFGIAIGDDCEAQFEFVGNSFIKTFFGFTGIGTEQAALDGKLVLGPSFYSPTDPRGNKREKYKIEYVNRNGKRYITHDNTPGTSQDIIMALSPDGSEMEMRVELKGFLKDTKGIDLVKTGNVINIAIGAEGASDHLGSDKWGADSSPVIYNYVID